MAVSFQKISISQVGHDFVRILFGRAIGSRQAHLGIQRRLVRVIDTREAANLSSARFGVHAFCVTLFTNFQRSIDENFNELFLSDRDTTFIPSRAVGTHRGASNNPSMPYDFRCDEADSADIRVSIFLTKTEALR